MTRFIRISAFAAALGTSALFAPAVFAAPAPAAPAQAVKKDKEPVKTAQAPRPKKHHSKKHSTAPDAGKQLTHQKP